MYVCTYVCVYLRAHLPPAGVHILSPLSVAYHTTSIPQGFRRTHEKGKY